MREQPALSLERLYSCCREQYALSPATIEFLALGLDSNAGVYRVMSEQGSVYLLKVKQGSLYEPTSQIPYYLKEQGIAGVVAPVPTKSGSLWTRIDDWNVLVYPFLVGETSWTGMTDAQWEEVGAIFRRVHQVSLPSSGFEALRKESFDTTEYVRWLRAFESQLALMHEETSPSRRELRAAWLEKQATLHTAIIALETLGQVLDKRNPPYVICHADLHPANLLRDAQGRVFVLDWDEVMLAPKERDFLFIRVSAADSELQPGKLAFFAGYGEAEIDWIVLAYYRYERVVQDVIECARDVFFRDNWGEEARADAVTLFRDVLAPDSELTVATQTLAQLPAEFVAKIMSGSGCEEVE
ncbi:aminoglycoside phosphotransferase family protein [Ktedonosporobacter rubrisoli]|uniref:Aminoglycoside phosphotransferase family protein n=1 Tax=Ktedonosporobacter rubrisoli TaxID=2509675 RepID=A0A4P6JJ66_KTERU|nr:phosphotransferase [Ktedonosporobacter rubrisoli]QBD75145.1 aminoglycoside phosphotransferase family protein [Ktedonosporobacter rubrisoli]